MAGDRFDAMCLCRQQMLTTCVKVLLFADLKYNSKYWG